MPGDSILFQKLQRISKMHGKIIREKVLLYFDDDKELEYPIPYPNEECYNCGSHDDWEYFNHDWSMDGTKKTVTFRCKSRYDWRSRKELPYDPCGEFIVLIIDESTLIKEKK